MRISSFFGALWFRVFSMIFFSGSYIMTHEYWRFSIALKVGYHMLVHLVQLKWWAQRLYMPGGFGGFFNGWVDLPFVQNLPDIRPC